MAKRRARVEELEPRLLLSSDLAGALALPPPAPGNDSPDALVHHLEEPVRQHVRHELVFVDAGVDDWETLVEGLVGPRDDGVSFEVVVLDAGRDGIDQIGEALESRSYAIDAVHVVSHGTERGLQLGGTWLDGEQLARDADDVARWRDALSADADLLLYGCNLAGSSEGKALVEQLGALTGADVAASTDATGAALHGGDWDLEHRVGPVETAAAFSAQAQAAWGGLLEGTAFWTENGSSTPETSDFDGTNFGPEGSTQPVGEWEVMAGAEAPTRDEKILLGIDGAGVLTAQIWDGTSWNALPGIVEGLNPEEWAFDVAYESQSGDALIAWADPGAGGVQFASWDGTGFSGPIAVPVPVVGEPTQLRLASDPNSDEIMVVGSVNGLGDFAMVWDGANFVDGTALVGGVGSPFVTDIDVVYQGQSGNAFIVYGNAGDTLGYTIYDGSTWADGVLAPPSGPTGVIRWTQLAADPNSDRVAVAVGTDFSVAWASVWNGGAWEPSERLSNSTLQIDRLNVAVAFESTSGELVAAYTRWNQDEVRYQRWTAGGGWSGELVAPSHSSQPQALTLDADPNSDTIVLSVVEQNRQVSFAKWDGDGFGTPEVLEADAGTNRGQPFLFLWDQGPQVAPVPVDSIWLSLQDPLTAPPWSAGDLIRFGDPNLVLEPGTTLGTPTTAFDVELFSAGTNINAIHYVGRDIQVGASGFQLREGDLLLSILDNSAQFQSGSVALSPGFTNDLTVAKEDVFVFRPDTPGNYGSGSFAPLLVDPTGDHIGGITLIESDVRVGDADLSAGDFLFTRTNGGQNNSVFLFETTDVGAATAGNVRMLLDGGDPGVGLSDDIYGIDLVEERTVIGGRVLAEGTLLLTFRDGGNAGNSALPIAPADVFVLNVAQTTWIAGAGNGSATASLLAEAADVPFGAVAKLDGLTLGANAAPGANTAPTLTPSAPTLTPITEDDVANSGDLVADILGTSVTDPDGFAVTGIAVTSLSSSNGTWEYDVGGGWTAIGPVSETSALLLREGDRVRFVPDGRNADSASFDFRAWDQTSAVAGTLADTTTSGATTAFSVDLDTASIAVSAVNDRPILDNGATPVLDNVVEDNGAPSGQVGTLVSDLVDLPGGGGLDNVTDVDTGAVTGIAVFQADALNGSWHYSIDDGATWLALGTVNPNSARLLAADAGTRIYFQANPDFNGTITNAIQFRAWDQSAGTNGGLGDTTPPGPTAEFSQQLDSADITVTAANDAPVLTPSAPDLTPITEDDVGNNGDLVSDLLGTSVTDPDGDPEGIAIVSLSSGNGTWEYSTNGGGSWLAIAPVSPGSALLLRDSDRVRFVPDGQNGTTASFDFRAWDRSSGMTLPGTRVDASTVGGGTEFSTASDTASIAVADVNDQPILDNGAVLALGPIAQDSGPPVGAVGTLVRDLVDLLGGGGLDNVTDVDAAGVTGIAVFQTQTANGTWHYSTDDGASWQAMGLVTNSAARLLAADPLTRVYFQANPGFNGTLAAAIDFRAWDQSTGINGGLGDPTPTGPTSAFSDATESASLTVTAVNQPPSGTDGIVTTGEDQPYTFVEADFGFSDPDADGFAGIVITMVPGAGTLRNGATVLANGAFVSGADITAGNLVFTPGPDESGIPYTTLTFQVQDDSGLVGLDTDPTPNTLTIRVNPLNDAPDLTPAAPSLPPLSEDDVANGGELVSNLLAGSVTDADLGDPEGIAIYSLSSGNGSWEYSTDGGGTWLSVGPVTPTSALLLRASDRVRFVPDARNADSASFDFRAWDQSSGSAGTYADVATNGGTTAFSAATDTASVNVSAVNDAPVLDDTGTMTLTNVVEDDPNPPGDTVASILLSAGGDRITDVDAGALEGIAVTGVDDSNGTWQYSTDAGGSWNDFGAVADGAAVLLDTAARVRFVPGASYTGPSGDLHFRAWDQTAGVNGQTGVDATTNGGTTAFSTASETASLSVIATNDAPVLTPAGPSLPPLTEDQTGNAGELVSTLVGTSISDVDAGALQGIAVTGLVSSNGAWEYSLDGGGSWIAVPGGVSDTAALLLRDSDRIRFVPDGENADSASFDFRAWDRTSGVAGNQADASANGGTTAFSTAVDTASVAVSALNDAPILAPAGPALAPITEDETGNAGDLVGTLIAGSVSDVDAVSASGIAITGLASSNGTWEYSTDGGGSWLAVGAVSDTSALLLRATDKVRFVPDALNADSASFDFRAWDQTTGAAGGLADASVNGGTTAFSTGTDTASIAVSTVNDAPVLDASGTMTLPDVAESDPNPAGDTVANIVASAGGDRITDVDIGDPEGVAVIAVDDANGSWQYSTDGGTIWTAFGPVSNTAAVLLDAGARVRFVPNAGYLGLTGDLELRAWDQSVGVNGQSGVDTSANGATTPFSVATETATGNVTPQNFAPVLAPAAPAMTGLNEDATSNAGDSVASLAAGSITDPNAGALEGVAVTGLASGNGTWQFSTDGGASWTSIGAVSNANALLLRDVDRVRFVPDGQNADSASFDFRAWDRTSGIVGTKVDATATGGSTAFSTGTNTASVSVAPVNDAPALGNATLAPVTSDGSSPPGETVGGLFGGGFADIDAGAGLAGIAVIGNAANAGTEGVWEYSSDGSTWYAIGSVGDDASALVLSSATRVRFVPVAGFGGGASLAVRALDDSYSGSFSSTGGSENRVTVNAAANGGTSAIAGGTSSLTTSILPDLIDDVDEGPETEEPPEEPTGTGEPEPEEEPPAEDPEPEPEPEGPAGLPDSGSAGPGSDAPRVGSPLGLPVPPLGRSPEATDLAGRFSAPELRQDEDDEVRTASTRTGLDVLRDIYMGRSTIGADVLTSLIFRGERGDFLGELDAAQEDIDALASLETRMVSSSIAVTSGLSVGYVLWLTRGGLLIASLLSSLPAWRLVDPIPVLARLGLDDEVEEGESLDSIVGHDAEDESEETGTRA